MFIDGFLRIARETILLDIRRGSIGDGHSSAQDFAERELAVDRALLRLIQLACRTNRLARAVDLTRLLHHTPSFDAAIQVADFYHLTDLLKVIERLKNEHEAFGCPSASVSTMRPPIANTRGLRPEAQGDHSSLVAPRSLPETVDHPSVMGSSAQKRIADNEGVPSPSTKRPTLGESAQPAMAMGKPGLTQSRE